MKPVTDAPYRSHVAPPVPPVNPQTRSAAAVAALLVGCTAMAVLTAWWCVWVGEQFPIRVY